MTRFAAAILAIVAATTIGWSAGPIEGEVQHHPTRVTHSRPITSGGSIMTDGRRRLCGPTVIDSPGSYVATCNSTVEEGPIFEILADGVTLDLNGFVFECGDGPAITAQGVSALEITGGIIIAPWAYPDYAIDITSYAQGVRVSHNRLVIQSHGIRIEGTNFAIDNNVLHSRHPATGTDEVPVGGSISAAGRVGRVDDNTISGETPHAITLGAEWVSVRNNQAFVNYDSGITGSCRQCAISGNSIYGSGLGLSLAGSGNTISDNRFHGLGGSTAMVLFTSDSHVRDNNASPGGIVVHGSGNLLEANIMNGGGLLGLFFSADSENNVYRGNVARGNGNALSWCPGSGNDDFCDEGSNNTSGGGNYLPGPR